MIAGYTRLSRDDDRRNYVSIENQKLIISQYASQQGITVDRWYEDDGVSGYIFDRPGFCQMMKDLDRELDTVIVKDFSRLGRHNAKVLLLLDEFQEREKRLIAIDDRYDSENPEDDTIGIKTWFNEKYVKDTSKKIRAAVGARQRAGTLLMQPPFGYRRNKKKREIIEIVPKEAEYVRMIFDVYIAGAGYRKTADYLTESGIPTPSMIRLENDLEEGRCTKRRVADAWSAGMVKDLLDNDFYTGTLRLHKRARTTVHGKDRRIPKEDQYVFENHHPAIVDRTTFDLVQEMKEKRDRNSYHGSRGNWTGTDNPNPFGGCLFCKDCGSRLTPIRRRTTKQEQKYYICSTYNRKGRRYCAGAHLIEERDLMKEVMNYLRLCRICMHEEMASYDMEEPGHERKSAEKKREELQSAVEEQKILLKTLLAQKIRDLSSMPDNQEPVKESYDILQKEITARILGLEERLERLKSAGQKAGCEKEEPKTASGVMDRILEKGMLNRKDMELLIERITVDENGFPEIALRYGLPDLARETLKTELNRTENERILAVMRLAAKEKRGFLSVKSLSEKLSETGRKKTQKSVLPYIGMMLDMGIIVKSDNPRRPYTIVKKAGEIERIMEAFCKENGLCDAHED